MSADGSLYKQHKVVFRALVFLTLLKITFFKGKKIQQKRKKKRKRQTNVTEIIVPIATDLHWSTEFSCRCTVRPSALCKVRIRLKGISIHVERTRGRLKETLTYIIEREQKKRNYLLVGNAKKRSRKNKSPKRVRYIPTPESQGKNNGRPLSRFGVNFSSNNPSVWRQVDGRLRRSFGHRVRSPANREAGISISREMFTRYRPWQYVALWMFRSSWLCGVVLCFQRRERDRESDPRFREKTLILEISLTAGPDATVTKEESDFQDAVKEEKGK